MGRWDLSVKILAWESPQDIVTLVMPGARYIRRREAQFQTQALPERPLPMREIRSDGVLEVEIAGQRFLIVVEVQSTKDEEMGERLLDYSYGAKRLHGLPVAAWVLYLLHVFEPPPSPLEWPVPGLGMVLTFQYGSIELAGMPLEELEQKELVGLAPLLLLTKGGAKREVIERAIPQLEAAHKPEGLAILQLIASFVFEKDPVELAWVRWRFSVMHDYLLENSIMYKELFQEGFEIGFKEGLEQGLKESTRASIEAVVQARFPVLLNLAREKIEQIHRQKKLDQVSIEISVATNPLHARRYLLALNESE